MKKFIFARWYSKPNHTCGLANFINIIAHTYSLALNNDLDCYIDWNGSKLSHGVDIKDLEKLIPLPQMPSGQKYGLFSLPAHFQYEEPLGIVDNCMLAMPQYTQSWKYHKGHEKKLRKLFKNLIGKKKPFWYAGIHLRFGDYVSKPAYTKITPEWLSEALKTLPWYIYHLHIFTNDIGRARGLVGVVPEAKRFYITYDIREEKEGIEVFKDMTTYRTFICSCSTFSYWACYLGNTKRVIIPTPWYTIKDGKHETDEGTYLPHWKTIKT